MASVSDDGDGRRRVQFVGGDGKRRCIRLGKATARQAEAFRLRVEELVKAQALGQSADEDTERWLAGLSEMLHGRVVSAGLASPRASGKLGQFIDAYIAGRADLKPSTAVALKQARRDLVGFFTEGRDLRSITPGDADEWRVYLVKRGLGPNTVRRRCGRAKQFFRAALRKRLVSVNPFADLKSAVQANPDRSEFVSRETAQRVLDACPDAEWRLIFA